MPISAFGHYEVVITTPVDGKDKVVATKSFNYIPLHRIMLIVLVLAGGIICLFKPWRQWRHMTIERWLIIIPVMPLLVFLIFPTPVMTTLAGLVFAQLFGLCAMMLVAGKSQVRRRTVGFLLVYALNALPAIGVTAIAGRSWGYCSIPMAMGIGSLGSLVWYLPAMFSLIAIRRRYSILRLLAGLGISWLIVILIVIGAAAAQMGGAENLIILLPITMTTMMLTSVFLVGFLILMITNRWCREGIIRTFGLDRDRPKPPPLP